MTEQKIITKIEELEKEKALRIKETYYERAAQIRDMVRHLRNDLKEIQKKK